MGSWPYQIFMVQVFNILIFNTIIILLISILGGWSCQKQYFEDNHHGDNFFNSFNLGLY